jgi:hypothetical protein
LLFQGDTYSLDIQSWGATMYNFILYWLESAQNYIPVGNLSGFLEREYIFLWVGKKKAAGGLLNAKNDFLFDLLGALSKNSHRRTTPSRHFYDRRTAPPILLTRTAT